MHLKVKEIHIKRRKKYTNAPSVIALNFNFLVFFFVENFRKLASSNDILSTLKYKLSEINPSIHRKESAFVFQCPLVRSNEWDVG